MAFLNGNKGKPKGAVNKVTQDIRIKFQQLLDGISVNQMQADLMDMEPKDRMNIIAGLSEYIIPKLARTTIDGEVSIKTISETTVFSVKPKK